MEREALKLALKVLEDLPGFRADIDNAITAIKEALAQPAQEPWRESASDYERGFIDGMQKQAQSSVDKAVNRMAQRPWIGLTDEEFQLIYDMGRTPTGMMEMVEAKLKEKNNAA